MLANSSTFFDPAALFGSGRCSASSSSAKQRYDVIILDTPPLLVNADAALLAQEADVLVLVARLNHLTKNQARRAVRVMAATHIAPTGLIVTGESTTRLRLRVSLRVRRSGAGRRLGRRALGAHDLLSR